MYANIVVIGSLNIDMAVRVKDRPVRGETVLGSDLLVSPGGKGANQAYALGKLQGAVSMIGCVGNDSFGHQLKKQLKSVQVDTSCVQTIEHVASGTAFISIDEQGDNAIIVAPGANAYLTPDMIMAYESVIAQAKLIVLQLEIPLETVQRVVNLAKSHGVSILLDPAPAQKLSPEILAEVDYLTPNQSELASLTGIPVHNKISAQQAAQKLLDMGVKTVFAKLGSQGVLVLTKHQTLEIMGHCVEVKDTTAAGDTFAGALAFSLIQGYDLRESAHFANAAAALSVTKFGAQYAMPDLNEVQKFLQGGVTK